jgi:hypothetical protein
MEATVHERFFQLAGLVRHEYWLHGQAPEDYAFHADPERLILRARKQRNAGSDCVLRVTEEMLLQDLSPLARHFYKELCNGGGRLSQERRGFKRRRQG